jgi:hypothetical protein
MKIGRTEDAMIENAPTSATMISVIDASLLFFVTQ